MAIISSSDTRQTKKASDNSEYARPLTDAEVVGRLCAEYLDSQDESEAARRICGHPRADRARKALHARQKDLDKLSDIIGRLALILLIREKATLDEYREHLELQAIDAEIPHFKTQEELDAWWEKLPKVKAEVDPRLLEKVKTSIRLNRKVIDGYDFLAKRLGLRSGQTLMKIVLDNYLAKNLPPDF